MRLLLRCGVVRDQSKQLPAIQAASDEEAGAARWFATSFDLKAVLAVAGLATTLMVQHVNTQTTITRLQADIEAEKTARIQTQRQNADRISGIEGRVVNRTEVEGDYLHLSERLTLQQSQLNQLFAIQLAHAGGR